jgi:peptidoglycan hydrolase-like protein with peptidoglycan-binding domain
MGIQQVQYSNIGGSAFMSLRPVRRWAIVSASALAVASAVSLGGLTAGAEPAHAATKCISNTYSLGGQSTCIGYIQQMLNWWQKPNKIAVDNGFGPITRNAVIQYQRSWSGQLSVDGIVGPKTWSYLCSPTLNPWGSGVGYPVAAARAAGCPFYGG